MFRVIPLTLAFALVACSRDEGPPRMSAPSDASYTSDVNNTGEGSALNSDDAAARALLTHVHVKTRECDGPDGHYAESKNVFTGTSTGDPRLSGAFEFAMLYDLFNVSKSNGPDVGNFTVRDPSTGRVKAEGVGYSWGRDNWLQGTIVGVVRDDGTGGDATAGSGKWVATYRIEFTGAGASVDIGGSTTPPNQSAAGIASGGCPGAQYTEFDLDFGGGSASSVSAAAATATSRHRVDR